MIRIAHAFCVCSEINWWIFVNTITLNIPVTPPAQRVQFILGEDADDGMHEPHPLFAEMVQLVHDGNEMEWRETARYIVLVVRDMLHISCSTDCWCSVRNLQICSIIIIIIFFNYALQPLRLIVRSWLDIPNFATRRLHVCHHARAPSGGRWNCGREISGYSA